MDTDGDARMKIEDLPQIPSPYSWRVLPATSGRAMMVRIFINKDRSLPCADWESDHSTLEFYDTKKKDWVVFASPIPLADAVRVMHQMALLGVLE